MRIVVLVSGSGTNLQAVIDAVSSGALEVEIAAVGSDVPDCGGLERSAAAGIETFAVPLEKGLAWKDPAHAAEVRAGWNRELCAAVRSTAPIWWSPAASCASWVRTSWTASGCR